MKYLKSITKTLLFLGVGIATILFPQMAWADMMFNNVNKVKTPEETQSARQAYEEIERRTQITIAIERIIILIVLIAIVILIVKTIRNRNKLSTRKFIVAIGLLSICGIILLAMFVWSLSSSNRATIWGIFWNAS